MRCGVPNIDLKMQQVIFAVVFVVAGFLIISLYNLLVIKPKKIREFLKQQGIDGPKHKILLGNSLEIKKSIQEAKKAMIDNKPKNPPVIHNAPSVFPFIEKWRKHYGPVFTFSLGKYQILCVTCPEFAKEITRLTSMDLGRPSFMQEEQRPLLGRSIINSNGPLWARQRKIMAPEFYTDKVKGMMSIITESALELINSWKHEIETSEEEIVDISVIERMKRFSGDIISRACFGSSYSKGEEIFLKLGALRQLMAERVLSAVIPGLRLLPTKSNRKIWALEKEICGLILKVVKEREKAGGEKDLLQMLLEGAKTCDLRSDAIDQFMVDNCRGIYLAGFSTTAMAASWCLMLLASNPEWQNSVRDEVNETCHGRVPDIDMLRKMKQLHMVIQETLRLYPVAPMLPREPLKDMKIGNVKVPKGVNIWVMMANLNTDVAIWGPDAFEFKPQRFQNGIADASNNLNCYLPFGSGQRVCIGQQLAMVELKLLISLIVSTFSFTLSPKYTHSPVMRTIIEPEHGVNLLIRKL